MFRQTLSILFFQRRPLADFVGLRRKAVWALGITSALKGLFVVPYYGLPVLMQMLFGLNLQGFLLLFALGWLLYWPGFLIFAKVLDAWLRRVNPARGDVQQQAGTDKQPARLIAVTVRRGMAGRTGTPTAAGAINPDSTAHMAGALRSARAEGMTVDAGTTVAERTTDATGQHGAAYMSESEAAADARFSLLALAWAGTDVLYLALQFQPNPSWLLAEPLWFVAVASVALPATLSGLGYLKALVGVLISLLVSAAAVLGTIWVWFALSSL